jgi:hypothetical protein
MRRGEDANEMMISEGQEKEAGNEELVGRTKKNERWGRRKIGRN